jgi:hypothetical protein
MAAKAIAPDCGAPKAEVYIGTKATVINNNTTIVPAFFGVVPKASMV